MNRFKVWFQKKRAPNDLRESYKKYLKFSRQDYGYQDLELVRSGSGIHRQVPGNWPITWPSQAQPKLVCHHVGSPAARWWVGPTTGARSGGWVSWQAPGEGATHIIWSGLAQNGKTDPTCGLTTYKMKGGSQVQCQLGGRYAMDSLRRTRPLSETLCLKQWKCECKETLSLKTNTIKPQLST